MTFSFVVHRSDIKSDYEETQRYIIRLFDDAYRQTGLLFTKLSFGKENFKEDQQGNIVSVTIDLNRQNSDETSDFDEYIETKVFRWTQFASQIINWF